MSAIERSAGVHALRSAVFVDFDNVYIGLRNLDPQAAETFASDPAPWLQWIEGGMPGREAPRLSDLGERRVLIRRCYLNPVTFFGFRPFFTRAGFSVIDCPPLTGQGKTSTDIHMVMDILDTLTAYDHVSEYIVLSGDADFTPVLQRLRAHDKRTVVLPVGPAAAAYRAAADRVLAENDFIEVGLGLGSAVDLPPLDPGRPGSERADGRTGAADADPARSEFRRTLLEEVRQIVDAAPAALPLARVAHELRAMFGQDIDDSDWAGTGSFKGLLRSDPELGLEVTAGAGSIYDPSRHEAPTGTTPAGLAAFAPELGRLVSQIAAVTGAPTLTAEQHAHVFRALAERLAEHRYELSSTSKAVRDRCVERGQRIARGPINFILKGIAYREGFKAGAAADADRLAAVYAENVLSLAAAAQLVLAPEDHERAERWLSGRPDV